MYVPPYDALLRSIGTSRADVDAAATVTIPTPLFRFLLQIAVAHSDFNEAGYLRANPDIAEAMRKGAVADPRLHYVGYGFFEGRQGATPEVDEHWYLRSYPDVGAAVKAGKIGSATEHFHVIGASEGRSPDMQHETDAAQWKKVLRAA